MNRIVSVLCWAVWAAPTLASEPQGASETLVSRYTSIALAPTLADADPLESIVTLHFPRAQVNTVGEAVHHLLVRTGYRLGQIDTAIQEVFALPLPQVHRKLGPCSVRTALRILMGESYVLVTDPARRVVGYALTTRTKKLTALPREPAAATTKAAPTERRHEALPAIAVPPIASWSTTTTSSADDIEVIVVPLKD